MHQETSAFQSWVSRTAFSVEELLEGRTKTRVKKNHWHALICCLPFSVSSSLAVVLPG